MQNIRFNVKSRLNIGASPLAIALILLCIILTIITPYFLTLSNWLNILLQSSTIGILAIGTTYVILAGGIDLSIASVMAFAGILAASFQAKSLVLGIIVPLLMGTLIGFINGFVVAKAKIQAFIFTLGMGMFVRGLAYVFTNGEPVYGVTKSFRIIGGGYIGFVPVPVCIFLLIIIITYIIMKYKKFGRYIYAIGGNEEAARLSGVRTDLIKILVFSINGLLAGLAGIILTSRLNAAEPVAGIGNELDAVAAVVIGGTSLRGGKGSVIGTVIGILIIGVVGNGLNILDISPYVQQVVKGFIIMIAVLSDRGKNKK